MSFPSLPKDVNQIPISSIYIPGTGFVALQGINSSTDGSGNASAGVVAALYGKNTNPGDTAVLVDSAGHILVNIANGNSNGQAAMVASAPVVIASDQSKLPTKAASGDIADGAVVGIGTTTQTKATDATITSWSVIQLLKGIFNSLLGILTVSRSTVAVYSLASTATTSSSNSGDVPVGPYTEISLDITTTAQTGTNPTLQFFYERKGADGLYYVLWQSAVLSAATNTLSTSIGAGMAYNQSLSSTGRLRWVIGGTATPGYTFSANITGK